MTLRFHMLIAALLGGCASSQGSAVMFDCPSGELKATFYATEPGTLTIERGGRTAFLTQQPAASGTKYQGAGDLLWEHQGEARVVWGYGRPEETCRKR